MKEIGRHLVDDAALRRSGFELQSPVLSGERLDIRVIEFTDGCRMPLRDRPVVVAGHQFECLALSAGGDAVEPGKDALHQCSAGSRNADHEDRCRLTDRRTLRGLAECRAAMFDNGLCGITVIHAAAR